GKRGAVAVKSTAVVRPVRPWVSQPYYGAVFDGVTLAPSWPPRLCRRRRPSTCVKPRLQQHVLAVHISGLAKPLDDCLEVLVSEILDASNPRKFFCRLLRPRRCTELEASAPFASAPQPCGRSRNSFPFHLGNG